jgi:hypothetical protein
MAYATGTATGCAAVLQALATFAAAHGWTVDNNAAYLSGWWLAVHKGSCYLNFQAPSTDDSITIYGATAFSGGATPSTQAQTSLGYVFTAATGPYAAYHFFSSSGGTYLHALIEISTDIFAHFHGGQLNIVGGASPCIYVTASRWNAYAPTSGSDPITCQADHPSNTRPFDSAGATHPPGAIACTVDSTFRWFVMGGSVALTRVGPLGQGGGGGPLPQWQRSGIMASPNTFNGVAVLYPLPIFVERAAGSIFSMVGEVPDLRYVNLRYNNAKDEITIGSDVWKLYPLVANIPPGTLVAGGPASSYPFGIAFKKSA